ncbi:MAG: hypothetical protein WC663_00270 [Patescibacteria group bacterium]|jgi:hypothetical protein
MTYEEYKNLKPHFSHAKPSKRIPKHDPKLIQELLELAKKNHEIREKWEAKHGISNEYYI